MPVQGQVYMGDGKSAILPLSSDGRVNPFEMRNKPPVLFDNPLKDLAPVKESESKNQASVIDGSSKVVNNISNVSTGGLSGANNKDLDTLTLAVGMSTA